MSSDLACKIAALLQEYLNGTHCNNIAKINMANLENFIHSAGHYNLNIKSYLTKNQIAIQYFLNNNNKQNSLDKTLHKLYVHKLKYKNTISTYQLSSSFLQNSTNLKKSKKFIQHKIKKICNLYNSSKFKYYEEFQNKYNM